jgi:hypothetical protein
LLARARENVVMWETDPKIPWSMIEGLVWSGTRKLFSGTVPILLQFNSGHRMVGDQRHAIEVEEDW